MRESLKQELKAKGCEIEDKYHKTISHINIDSRNTIQWILEKNGYEIIEPQSSETTITYKATPKFFKQIVEKYDLNSIFQAIECWGEIAHQNECSMSGSGAEFSISHKCGFHFCIDFKNHKIKTLHFGDERIIKDYNGKECYIDEIQCSDTDKLILEAIWKLDEESEKIRWLPHTQAPKKVVEYKKLLKKWKDFLSALSKDWKGSTLVFGKVYSIEKDIEYWEENIRKQSQKYIL